MFTLSGTVNEASSVEVFSDGGYELRIAGEFESDHTYRVYIGDYRSESDPVCYSSIPKQGSSIKPQLNGVLYAYTPLLAPSGSYPYSITVVDELTLDTQTLTDILYARLRQFYNRVYRLRKALSPKYKTGARAITEE